jgi:hypothetical protein
MGKESNRYKTRTNIKRGGKNTVSNMGFNDLVLSRTRAMHEELELLRGRVKELNAENHILKDEISTLRYEYDNEDSV